jgi:hypothetical protein
VRYNLQPIEESECFLVTEESRYICRSGAKGIQESVVIPLQHPVEKVADETVRDSQSIRLRLPAGFEVSPQFRPQKGFTFLPKREQLVEKRMPDNRHWLEFDLKPFQKCDGLNVEYYRTFVQKGGLYFPYSVRYPTAGFEISIFHPPEFEVVCSVFGLPEDDRDLTEEETWMRIRTDAWLLPFSGFAFQMVRRRPDDAERSSGAASDVQILRSRKSG